MYYLGFLKDNTKDVVIFKSIKKPSKGDFSYFTQVMGPYQSEANARKGLIALKKAYGEYGYQENPVKESRAQYIKEVKRAIALTRKVMKLYGKIRKKNPGKSYHDQKFMMFMKDLEKYVVGSAPYIATLAKAYEHLESAKDSMEEHVRG